MAEDDNNGSSVIARRGVWQTIVGVTGTLAVAIMGGWISIRNELRGEEIDRQKGHDDTLERQAILSATVDRNTGIIRAMQEEIHTHDLNDATWQNRQDIAIAEVKAGLDSLWTEHNALERRLDNWIGRKPSDSIPN